MWLSRRLLEALQTQGTPDTIGYVDRDDGDDRQGDAAPWASKITARSFCA